MLGRPARSRHGGAALVLVLAATLVAALPGAAAPARAATVATVAGDTTVTPSVLEFGEMAPGTTQERTATLITGAPDEAAFVRAVVTGAGPLVGHLTTRVEACSVEWTTQGCGAGEVLLVTGAVDEGVDTAVQVPVPTNGVAHLRIALTLDAAAPDNAASTVRHELHLVAPDAVPPVPVEPGPPVPLPTTGAEVAALGAAALALVALGLTLRTWGRERRRAVSAGWTT